MGNRVIKETYGNRKEILKFNEFVSTVVLVGDAGVPAKEGKKIVPAGTIVGGKSNPALENKQEPVEDKNTAIKAEKAEGVLLYDVDVTNGPREGSMILWGFVDLDKIPKAPVDEVVLPMIKFMK